MSAQVRYGYNKNKKNPKQGYFLQKKNMGKMKSP